METINDRFKQLRKACHKTQDEFAKIFGMSSSGICDIEKGRNNVTEKHMIMLSNWNERRINIEWLKTGKGGPNAMFLEIPESDEYREAAKMISQENDIDAMNAVIEYWKLDPSSKKAVWNFIRNLSNRMSDSDNYNTSSSTPQTDITLDPRDAATLSAAVQEAENSYIKSRSISARKMESSASSTIDGESRKVINR